MIIDCLIHFLVWYQKKIKEQKWKNFIFFPIFWIYRFDRPKKQPIQSWFFVIRKNFICMATFGWKKFQGKNENFDKQICRLMNEKIITFNFKKENHFNFKMKKRVTIVILFPSRLIFAAPINTDNQNFYLFLKFNHYRSFCFDSYSLKLL